MDSTIPMAGPPGGPAPVIPEYEILQAIGRGGMGRVYRARDLRLHRQVAIKTLLQDPDPRLMDRFLEEVRAAAALQHPQIARLYEFGTADGVPFCVMEFAAGGTLAEFLADRPLEPRLAAQIVAALALAIHYAHQQGIIHRDLKPSNILLAEPPDRERRTLNVATLRIADFGLARQLESDSRLTRTGEIVGTPSYMPPEQASGVYSRIGPAADIYSLGAILYELLTGRPPFLAADAIQTVMLVLSEEPVSLRSLQPALPADLQTICLKCLEKKPARRYATAAELADDLERFLTGQPIRARPVTGIERLWKWGRRNPWQAAAAVLLVGSTLAATVGIVVLREANRKLAASIRESNSAFTLSQDALTRIVDRMRNELYTIPQTESLMLATGRDSVELYRRLHMLRPDDDRAARDYLRSLSIHWLSTWLSGQRDDSEKLYVELVGLVTQLRLRLPLDIELAVQELQLRGERADQLRKADRAEEAVNLERQLEVDLQRLLAAHPRDPGVLKFASEVQSRAVTAALARQDVAAALVAQRARVDFSRQYWQAETVARPTAALWLVRALTMLGDMQLAAGPAESARTAFAEAQQVIATTTFSEDLQRDLTAAEAALDKGLGQLALKEQQYAAARESLGAAEARLQQLHRDFPQDAGHRHTLAEVSFLLAFALSQLDELPAARAKLAEARGLIDGLLRQRPDDYAAGQLRDRIAAAETALQNSPDR